MELRHLRYFVAVADAGSLTVAAARKLLGAPTYQRLVSKSRIRDIGKFIKAGGFFPTNLLVNFVRNVRFDQTARDENADVAFGTLYLPDKYRSAWIIDGQHRLYGFSPIDDGFSITMSSLSLSKSWEKGRKLSSS